MMWSNVALKGTVGVGTLGLTAILADALDRYIGVWGLIFLVIGPFALLVFFKIGELPALTVKFAHAVAAFWYCAMVVGAVVFMAVRGFENTDLLMGFLMIVGLIPIALILRGLLAGQYDHLDP